MWNVLILRHLLKALTKFGSFYYLWKCQRIVFTDCSWNSSLFEKYFQKVSLMCAFCLFRVMHLVWNDVRLAEILRRSTGNTFFVLVKCKANVWYRCVCLRTYWLCVRGWSKRTWLYVFLKHFQMNVLASDSQGSQEETQTLAFTAPCPLVHWAPMQSLEKRASFVCCLFLLRG